MSHFHFTTKGGEHRRLGILNAQPTDYSLVMNVRSQNLLRKLLSILRKHRLQEDLAVSNEQGFIQLWAYTRNWSGRACFIAGVLYGSGVKGI